MPQTQSLKSKAELKRLESKRKQEITSVVFAALMNILESSDLYGSKLWPKNGFKAGWDNLGKNDVVGIIIHAGDCSGIIQMNIWNRSEARIIKQCKALHSVMHQAVLNDIYFSLELDFTYGKVYINDYPGTNILLSHPRFTFNFST